LGPPAAHYRGSFTPLSPEGRRRELRVATPSFASKKGGAGAFFGKIKFKGEGQGIEVGFKVSMVIDVLNLVSIEAGSCTLKTEQCDKRQARQQRGVIK